MRRHRRKVASRWIAATVSAALLALGGIGCGGDEDDGAPSLDDPNATGEELVNEYFTLLTERDTEGLEGFLSDAFIVQRADGSTDTKDNYLTDFPEIREFKLSGLSASQDGDALVARYDQTVEEIINGKPFRTDPAPRLSTFVWVDGEWRLISHANFNAPEAGSGEG